MKQYIISCLITVFIFSCITLVADENSNNVKAFALTKNVNGIKIASFSQEKDFNLVFPWPKNQAPTSLLSYKDYIKGGSSQLPSTLKLSTKKSSGTIFYLKAGKELSVRNPRCLEAILNLQVPVVVRLLVAGDWSQAQQALAIGTTNTLPTPSGETIVCIVGYDNGRKVFTANQLGGNSTFEISYDYLSTYAHSGMYKSSDKSVIFSGIASSVNETQQTVELTPATTFKTIKLSESHQNAEIFELACQNVWSVVPKCTMLDDKTVLVSIEKPQLFSATKPASVKVTLRLQKTNKAASANSTFSATTARSTKFNWTFAGRSEQVTQFRFREVLTSQKEYFFEIPGTVTSAQVTNTGTFNIFQALILAETVAPNLVRVYPRAIAGYAGSGIFLYSFHVRGFVEVTYK